VVLKRPSAAMEFWSSFVEASRPIPVGVLFWIEQPELFGDESVTGD